MGVFMSGAGPHYPKYPDDIVRIHSLTIYSDIVEYNILVIPKPLFRCIHFSKVKNYIMLTGQCINYQDFSDLQFEKI